MARESVKIKTGVVRFSYVNVFAPRSISGNEEDAKYSVTLLIDKKDDETVAAIKEGIKRIWEAEKSSTFKGKKFDSIKKCLRDGDEDKPDDPNYAGMWFVNATSKQKPGVIDRAKNELDEDTFYSGCYGRATIVLAPYSISGSVGIGAYVNNILKTKDGERLAGRASAESDFADDFDDDEDDESLM